MENILSSSTSYYNITTNVVANGSVMVYKCNSEICEYHLEVIQDLCLEQGQIAVSAINELGQGPFTEAIVTGMISALTSIYSYYDNNNIIMCMSYINSYLGMYIILLYTLPSHSTL